MFRDIGRIVLAAALLGLSSVGSSAQSPGFYEVASTALAGDPGSIIHNEKIDDAPYGGSHYRVLYRSRGLKDEPIAVSGMIFVPAGEMPEAGWPIIAWAHPTSGLVAKCGPSVAAGGLDQVQGLEAMLNHGFVVTATDYPGLGTPGPHPFLVGESEGRAVLDSIRAARELTGSPPGKAALWGHSQGGQAVLFAADIAASYAPDLHIAGVAAAAPATELKALMQDDIANYGGKNLLAMTLWSWDKIFDAPISEVVTPQAMRAVDNLANQCLESIFDLAPRFIDGEALQKSFLSVDDIASLEPWRTLMAKNTIGPLPPEVPVLLVQGTDDTTVEPAVTKSYLGILCKGGSSAELHSMPGVGHITAARDGAPTAIAWMADRLAGKPAPSDCP